MSPSEIDQTIAGVRAWLEGKPAQYHEGDGVWLDVRAKNEYIGVTQTRIFRPKPEPKLRPWKAEEVPMDAWYREKPHPDEWFRIASRWVAMVGGERFIYIEMTDHDRERTSLEYLFSKFEHSIDGGRTWLPCGVLTEENP